MISLQRALLDRPYPGRGCVVARLADGSLHFAYFLTGRSDASRCRALDVHPRGDVEVVDTAGAGSNDALRHYLAAVHRGTWSVVGNGDQVEPLATSLAEGADPVRAWSVHTYEPDPPIFTPRIWLAYEGGVDRVLVGSARRSGRPDGSVDRIVWMPDTVAAGSGVVITTYAGTVDDAVPSALPVDVTIDAATGRDLLAGIWDSLSPSLRVAAFVAQPADLKRSLLRVP